MKKLLFILLFTVTAQAQMYVSLGLDPKIAILGTDNEFTSHDAVFNVLGKVEYIDNKNTYLALGFEYANLREWYLGYYFNGGYNIKVVPKVSFIPNIELGFITRQLIKFNEFDERGNPVSFYGAANIPVRYKLSNKLSVELQSKVQLATDISGRLLRHSGYVNLIYHL